MKSLNANVYLIETSYCKTLLTVMLLNYVEALQYQTNPKVLTAICITDYSLTFTLYIIDLLVILFSKCMDAQFKSAYISLQ